jgi:hypothetical protein
MSPRVFISYRREQTAGIAGRIADRLADRLGRDSVFMDVDAIDPGVDFVEAIEQHLSSCAALVCVIGPNWVAATDERGRRRLDIANDFVRIEVSAALERNVRVIPVLVDGASLPDEEELPEPLRKLVRRQALRISHERFGQDVQVLADSLERMNVGAAAGQSAPDGAASLSRVAEILSTFRTLDSFFVAPNIPPERLVNACRNAQVPADETPLALMDFTIFGNGNDAIVFTDRAIYSHHSLNTGHEKKVLPYAALRGRRIEKTGIWLLKLGDDVLKIDGNANRDASIPLFEALSNAT